LKQYQEEKDRSKQGVDIKKKKGELNLETEWNVRRKKWFCKGAQHFPYTSDKSG
jgi:hypothetical protein